VTGRHVQGVRSSDTGADNVPASYDELTAGQELAPVEYTLDSDSVASYVQAVGAAPRDYVPPLAVAARAIASLADLVAVPPGTIHASQEFDFSGLVPVGSRVVCSAKVHRKLARGPMRMLTLELVISEQGGRVVQRGLSTVVIPESQP
jgi:hypothetical protein